LCEGGELKDFLLGANKKKKKTLQVYMNKQSSRDLFGLPIPCGVVEVEAEEVSQTFLLEVSSLRRTA